MNNQNVQIVFNVQGNGVNALGSISQQATILNNTLNKSINIFNSFGGYMLTMQQSIQVIQGVGSGLNELNASGIALNTSLADLSAITGQTGAGLKSIESYARQSAKTFGGSAADAVESYKLILSQLSPEIAKVPEALKEMGAHIAILSKTMKGDTKAATEVLTTAMNQFQVSTVDPIAASKEMARMMNVMAAAAKEGSAELPQIKDALSQCGMAAKGAGVSFEEANAAIQVLDKAGKKGAEGGVALRNVMATLSMGRFLPKDVQIELRSAGVSIEALTDKNLSLSDRLRALTPVMNDGALITKLFGKENSNAAIALLAGTSAMDGYKEMITGTNTAVNQAGVIMESYAEKQARAQARIDDFKISLFNLTSGFSLVLQNFVGALVPFAQISPLFFALKSVISGAIKGVKIFSTAISTGGALTTWFTRQQYILTFQLSSLRASFFQSAVAIKSATVALGRFTTVGIYNAIKGIGAYILSLVAGSTASLSFAAISKVSFATFSFTAIAACKAVGVAIMNIPIVGWIAAAVAGIIILMHKLKGTKKPVEETMDAMNAAKEAASSYYAQEKMQLDAIFDKLKQTNPKSKERVELVRQLKEMYPELNAQTLEEITNTNNLASAYDTLITSISKKAKTAALNTILEEKYKENAEIDIELGGYGGKKQHYLADDYTQNIKNGVIPLKNIEYTPDAAGVEHLLSELSTVNGGYQTRKVQIGGKLFPTKMLEKYVKNKKEIDKISSGVASLNLEDRNTSATTATTAGVTGATRTTGVNTDLANSTDTITGGGKNVKIFNIVIESLIGGPLTNNFHGSEYDPQSAEDFKNKLSNVLQMLVNDVNYAAN